VFFVVAASFMVTMVFSAGAMTGLFPHLFAGYFSILDSYYGIIGRAAKMLADSVSIFSNDCNFQLTPPISGAGGTRPP
jgi:hypothetical protein